MHHGEHTAIIDVAVWDAVQAKLAGQAVRRRERANRQAGGAPLEGLVFDDSGNRMSPTFAAKAGRRYRYYVSAPLVRGGDGGIRVPAPDLEQLVVTSLADFLCDRVQTSRLIDGADASAIATFTAAAASLGTSIRSEATSSEVCGFEIVRKFVQQIEVRPERVVIELAAQAFADVLGKPHLGLNGVELADPVRIVVTARLQRCGKQVRLILGDVEKRARAQNPDLVRLVCDSRRWFEDLRSGRAATIASIAQRERQQVSHVSRTLSLAFLAPDIAEMILEGRQPTSLTAERLRAARPLPLRWDAQRALLLPSNQQLAAPTGALRTSTPSAGQAPTKSLRCRPARR